MDLKFSWLRSTSAATTMPANLPQEPASRGTPGARKPPARGSRLSDKDVRRRLSAHGKKRHRPGAQDDPSRSGFAPRPVRRALLGRRFSEQLATTLRVPVSVTDAAGES
jgi:hypothetical protein